jgi:hypothetical protein
MGKKKKPKMQDLTVNPEANVDIDFAVQKKRERERKNQLITNAYNKQFSMLQSKKLGVFWFVGGTLLAIGIAYSIGLITHTNFPLPF